MPISTTERAAGHYRSPSPESTADSRESLFSIVSGSFVHEDELRDACRQSALVREFDRASKHDLVSSRDYRTRASRYLLQTHALRAREASRTTRLWIPSADQRASSRISGRRHDVCGRSRRSPDCLADRDRSRRASRSASSRLLCDADASDRLSFLRLAAHVRLDARYRSRLDRQEASTTCVSHRCRSALSYRSCDDPSREFSLDGSRLRGHRSTLESASAPSSTRRAICHPVVSSRDRSSSTCRAYRRQHGLYLSPLPALVRPRDSAGNGTSDFLSSDSPARFQAVRARFFQ